MSDEEEKRGPGRKSHYKPEYADQAKAYCEQGATDVELASAFDVSVSTIKNWGSRYPEFRAALKVGKEIADERVVRSLYQRAVGYTYDACKIFLPKDALEPTVVPYLEHVPPDTTACIFWLKNRRSKEWRDRAQHEISGPDGGPIKADGTMTDLEAARLIAQVLLQAAKQEPPEADDAPKDETSSDHEPQP